MTERRDFLAGLTALAGSLVLARPGQAQTAPFVLGVLPAHSLRTLIKRYEPLRRHLEQTLRRTVRIESAIDFPHFHRRTLQRGFDLAVTPIHFARIAQLDAGWIPLVQFEPFNDAVLIYDRRRQTSLPEDLRGKQLAIIDKLAITVMAGLAMLQQAGLEPDRDFVVLEHRNHVSAIKSVLSGHSVAAITTSQGLRQIDPAERDHLGIYRHILDVPAFVFMAPPDTSPQQVNRLREILLGFSRNRAQAAFFEHIGYRGLHPADAETLHQADPYLKQTRQLLGR